MNKTKTEMERFQIDTDKPTPKLDQIVHDVKKLLAAGVATFIPKACNALREDWIPTMSDAVLKKNPAIQKEMRDRIMNAFAKEWSEDGVWGERSIEKYLEPFLRYAINQEANKESNKIANKASVEAAKYRRELEQSAASQNLAKIIAKSPEPPKEQEEEETVTGGYSMGPSKYRKLGEDTKSPLTKMGDIRDGSRIFWNALTGEDKDNKYMPHMGQDPIVDLINKTREYRKFVYELDENERTGLHEWITYTVAAANDMLDILEEADK